MEAPTPEQYYKFAHHCANEDRNVLADIFLIQSAILGHENGIKECEQRGLDLKLERYQKKIVKELKKEALGYSDPIPSRATKNIDPPEPEVNEKINHHAKKLAASVQTWKRKSKYSFLDSPENRVSSDFSSYVLFNNVLPEIVDKYQLETNDLDTISESSTEDIYRLLMQKKGKEHLKALEAVLGGIGGVISWSFENPFNMMVSTFAFVAFLSVSTTLMFGPPENGGWPESDTPSTYSAKRYLKDSLKDPGSYDSISWGDVRESGDGRYTVTHTYRAKNSFGGYVVDSATFTLDEDGDVINMKDN